MAHNSFNYEFYVHLPNTFKQGIAIYPFLAIKQEYLGEDWDKLEAAFGGSSHQSDNENRTGSHIFQTTINPTFPCSSTEDDQHHSSRSILSNAKRKKYVQLYTEIFRFISISCFVRRILVNYRWDSPYWNWRVCIPKNVISLVISHQKPMILVEISFKIPNLILRRMWMFLIEKCIFVCIDSNNILYCKIYVSSLKAVLLWIFVK